jgi:beta-phosphoglucomutase
MNDKLAVIFDMDGVLVDSYMAHFRSWQEVGAEQGHTVTEAEFAAQFGRTSREIIAGAWGGGAFTDAEIAALDDRKEAVFREILAADFPTMPGAEALLQALHHAGFALGVGSSGPPENVDFVLDHLVNRALFDAVVTGSDVTRGKPDPQVFLLVAQRLGAAPARCAVVEDAPVGVQAANAAGMTSIGFASTGRSRAAFADADFAIDALDELSPELIRRLILRQAGAANPRQPD